MNLKLYNLVKLTFLMFQSTYRNMLLLLKTTMDEIWIEDMLTAGKFPESEEEMMQYYQTGFSTNKLSYELISELEIGFFAYLRNNLIHLY